MCQNNTNTSQWQPTNEQKIAGKTWLFGKGIMTGDKTYWVFQYDPEVKCHSLQWKKSRSLNLKKMWMSDQRWTTSHSSFKFLNIYGSIFCQKRPSLWLGKWIFASWQCTFPDNTFIKVFLAKNKYQRWNIHCTCLILPRGFLMFLKLQILKGFNAELLEGTESNVITVL